MLQLAPMTRFSLITGSLLLPPRTRYIVASRECKRWEAVSRSPIYAFFSQSMKGLATIRAFSANEVRGVLKHDEILSPGPTTLAMGRGSPASMQPQWPLSVCMLYILTSEPAYTSIQQL